MMKTYSPTSRDETSDLKKRKAKKEKGQKNKKRKEKNKMREKERRDNSTISFSTLVLQSSTMVFIIESFLCVTSIY